MTIKRHIPNIITLLNLFCGCVALVFATESNFLFAFYFVCLGIFFDFFDGFFARLFKVSSPLGLQLDSLADMVTSGVVPGFVMFKMLSANVHLPFPHFEYLGFIITLGACFRLANFNIDTRQTDSFIGLPTPANALFILSLPLVAYGDGSLELLEMLTNQWVLLAIAILSAYVMNAEIPLFSLKIKKFTYKENSLQLFFLSASFVLLIFLQFSAIPPIIVLYILLSVISNKLGKK